MTLASYFCPLPHSRGRQTKSRDSRSRSRAVHRKTSFEVMEDRLLLSTVSFSTGSETVSESATKFSIPVTLSSPPDSTPTVSAFASAFDDPAGLAFDAAGNLFVSNHANNTVSEVSPTGVVSSFFSGLNVPSGLAFGAGNLYVTDAGNNTVQKISETVTVPFALGGTAVAGTDYSGVTASPLSFVIGQTTQFITGTLLSDPGPNRTLILTLGAPTGGTALGSTSVNTLTIDEPAVGTTTSTSTGSAVPLFLGEQRVLSGKGKHKKLVGFEFLFNGALDQTDAQSTGNYRVTQKHGKKPKVLGVRSALYSPSNFSVTISVAGVNTGKATQVTITGLDGANGVAIPEILTGL